MSEDREPILHAVLRELLVTLAHEVAEWIPGLLIRWARRRFGFDQDEET